MSLQVKSPGDKGYAAHWKRCMNGARLSQLKGQGDEGQRPSGRAIHMVLKTYGELINNTTGECWPSQTKLANDSGYSISVVARVQRWAIDHGWLEVIAPAIPRKRGIHVVALVPPTTRQTAGEWRGGLGWGSGPNSPSAKDRLPVNKSELPVSTAGETLISNSQFETLSPKRRAEQGSATSAMGQATVNKPWPSAQTEWPTVSPVGHVAPTAPAKADRPEDDPWSQPSPKR
jgi:hypothetical protein